MIDAQTVKVKLSKGNATLLKVAAVVGAITVIAGGYTFYLNTIWKPTVDVLSVDFEKGIASLQVGTKKVEIYGDALFQIGGDWGIKFGKNKDKYDSLQLTKKGMVVEYIKR